MYITFLEYSDKKFEEGYIFKNAINGCKIIDKF